MHRKIVKISKVSLIVLLWVILLSTAFAASNKTNKQKKNNTEKSTEASTTPSTITTPPAEPAPLLSAPLTPTHPLTVEVKVITKKNSKTSTTDPATIVMWDPGPFDLKFTQEAVETVEVKTDSKTETKTETKPEKKSDQKTDPKKEVKPETVKSTPVLKPKFTFVISGKILVPNWAVVNDQDIWGNSENKKEVRFKSKPIEMDQDTKELDIDAIGPKGETHNYQLLVTVSDPDELIRVLGISKPIKRAVTASLGFSAISYSETNRSDINLVNLVFKVTYLQPIFKSKWELGGNAFVSTLPISASPSGSSATFFGSNVRLGYVLPKLKKPWRVSLAGGVYFGAMFTPGGLFGYSAVLSVQIYPSARYQLTDNSSLNAYLKYVPLGDSFFGWNLFNRELAFGLGYTYTFKNGHSVVGGLDFSDMRLNISSGVSSHVVSTSFSGGYSYVF